MSVFHSVPGVLRGKMERFGTWIHIKTRDPALLYTVSIKL